MRIKTFNNYINESIKDTDNITQEYKFKLLDYCKEHLAYLIDDGLNISASHFDGDEFIQIVLDFKKSIFLGDVKDQIIPFLEVLLNDYKLFDASIDYESSIGFVIQEDKGISLRKLESIEELESIPDNFEFLKFYIKVR